MQIQVLGSGCQKCKKLFELTQKAVEELGLKADVEYITDIQKIAAMGLLSSPVLTIDGKAVLVGSVPDKDKLKQIISGDATTVKDTATKDNCSCNGDCK